MKIQLKNIVKSIIHAIVALSRKTRIGQYLHAQVVSAAMEKVTQVSYHGMKIQFVTPNSLCEWRAKSFSTKEPETLEWINAIPESAILWDVGANVGLYSVYAAKKRNCKIWAFEPSIFNLELLARNIFLNQLAEKVCIVPLALNSQLSASQLRMTTTEWGGALSTFGQDFGWDGKSIKQVFSFQTLGLSMNDAVQRLAIPQPDYIKMDVDGIEHLILNGGAAVLQGIKSILIEINDDFHEQADQCQSLLTQAGLILTEKRHSEIIANSISGFQNSYNQIWVCP